MKQYLLIIISLALLCSCSWESPFEKNARKAALEKNAGAEAGYELISLIFTDTTTVSGHRERLVAERIIIIRNATGESDADMLRQFRQREWKNLSAESQEEIEHINLLADKLLETIERGVADDYDFAVVMARYWIKEYEELGNVSGIRIAMDQHSALINGVAMIEEELKGIEGLSEGDIYSIGAIHTYSIFDDVIGKKLGTTATVLFDKSGNLIEYRIEKIEEL